MASTLINIRSARASDAGAICDVHDASWREAYRGIIPGAELEKIISKRGPGWWRKAILRGSNILLLDAAERIGGYVTFGRNRLPAMRHKGELFELYLHPEFQGLGFGRKMFMAAQNELMRHGYNNMIVWSLADNERAMEFYRQLGGVRIRSANESFGAETRERIAFEFRST